MRRERTFGHDARHLLLLGYCLLLLISVSAQIALEKLDQSLRNSQQLLASLDVGCPFLMLTVRNLIAVFAMVLRQPHQVFNSVHH